MFFSPLVYELNTLRKEDNDIEENEFDETEYIAALVERLEDETTVLHVPNGNYIIFAF